MANRFDVVVIGAGPAGYVAAIRCAQLGFATACVDDWRDDSGAPALGGTCLNVGCIPSKALLESSELYARARHDFAAHGIHVGELRLDLAGMMRQKSQVVAGLTRGVAGLFKANGVTAIAGRGRLREGKQVEVSGADGKPRVLDARHVILATGSSPTTLDVAPVDGDRVVDSTGGLAFAEVPGRLGVIGAGVIGLELGSVWRRLGAAVTLLEAQPQFLAIADDQIAREANRAMAAQGLDIRLGARVRRVERARDAVVVTYQDTKGDQTIEVDRLIVAVGRRPNSRDIAAPETKLLLDEWGFIHVDEHCRTNLPDVYAIGDVVRGPMLAHKGMDEGVMVAERLAGRVREVNYGTVPFVIYTLPEIAWVGKTEQALRVEGVDYRAGSFPMAANGRARAMGLAEGTIKLLAHAKTDRLLGVHLIGPLCAELVALGVMAMEFGAAAEDVALTMFAHPTVSEGFHEAALAVAGQPLHIARLTKRS